MKPSSGCRWRLNMKRSECFMWRLTAGSKLLHHTLSHSNDECNCSSAELYVPLQRWYLGDRSGPVEAPVGPQSLHSAHGALHRQDHGAGEELRPPDHRQTDLHTVSFHVLTQVFKIYVFLHKLVTCSLSCLLCLTYNSVFSRLYLSVTACRGRKCKPIFVQIARQVVKLNASDLRLPSRAWKVKLVGEGADDAGGVFDDTITEMCQVCSCSLKWFLVIQQVTAVVWHSYISVCRSWRRAWSTCSSPPPTPPQRSDTTETGEQKQEGAVRLFSIVSDWIDLQSTFINV